MVSDPALAARVLDGFGMSRRACVPWPRIRVDPEPERARRAGGASERSHFPLGEQTCFLTASVELALAEGLRRLRLAPDDEILMPAYHAGWEVWAVARAGFGIRFYDCGDGPAPDETGLDELVGEKTRALYLIHPFGFPLAASLWRAWADARGLLLVEDASSSWLAATGGRPVGSDGDIAVFGFARTLGLSDGAAVRIGGGGAAPTSMPRRARPGLAALEQRLRRYPAIPRHADMTRSAQVLLRRADGDVIAARRRGAAVALAAELGDLVAWPEAVHDSEAAPWVLPLRLADRERTLDRLHRANVETVALWPAPHPSLPALAYPRSAELRSLVGVPVHQNLGASSVRRMAAALRGHRRVTDAQWEPVDALEAARADWTSLAETTGNLFSTWEWAATWWRHFGADHELLLRRCVGSDGRTQAILPFYRTAVGPAPVARFIGHGLADQLNPVCAPKHRSLAAQGVLALARELGPGGVVLAERVVTDEGWPLLLGGALLRTERTPVIHVGTGDWPTWLARKSRSFRQQMQRRERRLVQAHDLHYRLVREPGEVDDAFDALVALHQARWGEESTAFTGARRAFHREFAHLAFERGWLRLWVAEIDGDVAAAWLGFRFGEAEWYYQSGRDPALEDTQVGLALLLHTIRSAVEDKVEQYKLLLGEEPYKFRLMTADRGLATIAIGRPPLPALLSGAARAARRTPTSLRRAVREATGA